MEKVKEEKSCLNYAKVLVVFSLILVSFGASAAAQAATLYFEPNSGSHGVGSTFPVSVMVSSAGQAMNATEGRINFPPSKLELLSLSKKDSIISLWVQEPKFSNAEGFARFEGVVLNPGFSGVGKIITLNFRAKTSGVATISFESGAVLANDGLGTDLLSGLGNATFTLFVPSTGPTAAQATTPSELAGVPAAPSVSSPTHPDPNKWYANNNPAFDWVLSKDITGVNVLSDREANTNPGTKATGLFHSSSYKNVDEGVWYFHLRLRNANGWGGVAHFRFQVDTQKPTRFDIKEILRVDLTEPKVKFFFDAADKTSGIDHYEVQIDDGNAEVWRDDGSHTYQTPLTGPGKHTLLAKVFDKAGNFLANSQPFVIQGLEPPTITDYPKELTTEDTLVVKGTTYPDSQVTVWLQKEDEKPTSQSVKSEADGKFTFISEEKLKEGVYKLWAEVADARKARSGPSETFTILVQTPAIKKLGAQIISFLSLLIILLALIILLIFMLWYAWHKLSQFKEKMRKDVRQVDRDLHKEFDLLREDTRKQVKFLEKAKSRKQLTEEEQRVLDQLKKDLDEAEQVIKKEMEKIEEELK